LSFAALFGRSAISTALLAEPPAVEPPAGAVMSEAVEGEVIVGWVEKGLRLPEQTAVKVEGDSGALISSIHAITLERFRRAGKRSVRYDVEVKEAATGEMITLQFERPAYRQITVRGAGGEDSRPALKTRMCIGNGIA